MAGWPGGRVAGWVYELKIRLNSASVGVELKLKAELGKKDHCTDSGFKISYGFLASLRNVSLMTNSSTTSSPLMIGLLLYGLTHLLQV